MGRTKTDKLISDKVAVVNQILPHTNKWAWQLFLDGCANNWMPTAVPMQTDISQWRENGILSEDEKLVVKKCLGFFAGSESLVSNNLLLNIFKYITDAECRQYIARQCFEESLHNLTVVYICDSLGLNIDEVYEAYRNVPAIKAKDDFLMKITSNINRPSFNINTIEGKRELARNIITYYIVCEGIFFFSGFAMLLSFGKQNKLTGIAKQIEYTLRDESIHIKFGTILVNKLMEQEPEVFSLEFQNETLEHIKKAIQLEVEYAKDVLPRGILGLNSDMFIEYMNYIADRRLSALGIDSPYANSHNPFGWMTETIDLTKNTNFFEGKVTGYQTGTLADDF